MPNPILKRFTVEGTGDFPADMLRVDRCWPATKEAAANISAPDRPGAQPRAITLETAAKYSPSRHAWRTLRWRVID